MNISLNDTLECFRLDMLANKFYTLQKIGVLGRRGRGERVIFRPVGAPLAGVFCVVSLHAENAFVDRWQSVVFLSGLFLGPTSGLPFWTWNSMKLNLLYN